MSHAIFLPIGLAVVGAVLGVVAVRLRRRGRGHAAAPVSASHLVRVLTTDEELRDAVRRAARFEQEAADRLRTRARRYEAMVADAKITELSPVQPARAPLPDDTPRSA